MDAKPRPAYSQDVVLTGEAICRIPSIGASEFCGACNDIFFAEAKKKMNMSRPTFDRHMHGCMRKSFLKNRMLSKPEKSAELGKPESVRMISNMVHALELNAGLGAYDAAAFFCKRLVQKHGWNRGITILATLESYVCVTLAESTSPNKFV